MILTMTSSKKTFVFVLALSAALALRGETIRLKAGDLAHRWSFNGNLKDSVGKSDATACDTVTLTKGQCLLPGGRHGSGAVSLGSGILPKDGGFTIELWTRQLEVRNWSRIFDMGSKLEDSLLMSWSCGVDARHDCVCIKTSNGARQWDALAPYDLDKTFHIAMTCAPRKDGLYDIACYKQDAKSGQTLRKLNFVTTPGWSPRAQNQANVWLGRSCAPADADAKAAYDEVRIWTRALSEAELSASVRLGANAEPKDGVFVAPESKVNPISPLHSQVTRVGNWQGVVARAEGFGDYAWASDRPGETMELAFEGTSCQVVFRTGARHWKFGTLHERQNAPLGAAEIFVDGVKAGSVETSKTGRFTAAEKLKPGRHVVKVVNAGVKTVPSACTRIIVHGFVVDKSQPGDEPDWTRESPELAAAARKLPPIVFFTGAPYDSGAIPNSIWDSRPRDGAWGCSIRVYDPSTPEKPARVVWSHPKSLIYDLALSDDAKKVWFTMRHDGARAWQIYSINLDGTGFRQITATPDAHNASPAPLADGRLAFVSSRTKGYHTVCQSGPCTHLYVMDGDGSNAKRLSSNTLSDFGVVPYGDGRLLFTRWEYVDWNLTYRQSLWTQYPDGRNLALWFGNMTEDPASFIQPVPIPGSPSVVCVLAPHHGCSYGAIGVVTNAEGPEGEKGVAYRVLTPEFPATEDKNMPWAYCWPHPAGAGTYLCSYGGGGKERFRISLIDERGNRATVYDAKETSAFRALPLVPRRPAPVLPAYKPLTTKTVTLPKCPPGQREEEKVGVGYLFVSDVQQGVATNVALSEMRHIRIMEQIPKTMNRTWDFVLDQGPLMSAGTYYAKRVWGYAPIETDGSAYFEVPALKEVYLQLVDGEGRELKRMTSALNVMPGSLQSCVGCHEHRATTGLPANGKAAQREPTPLKFPAWGNAGVIDYRRTVQPVFDRSCVRCHSGPNPPKGLSLTGNLTRFFCMSYDGLVNRSDANNVSRAHFADPSKPKGLVDCLRLLTGIGDVLRTKDSGSFASRLPDYFRKEHCGVDVSADDRRIVYEWIDAMVPYYPTADYAHLQAKSNRDKWGLPDEKGFQPWFTKRYLPLYTNSCASCHGEIRHNGYEWQGHWGWIDLTKPEWSPALVAHLPKEAGGRGLPARGKFQLKGKEDPLYGEMLDIFREAAAEAAKTPEADMDGFVPRSVGKGEFRVR